MGQRAARQASAGPPARQKSGQKSGEPEGSRQDSAGAGAGLDGAGGKAAERKKDPESTSMMDSVGDAIEEALGELSRVDTAASVWLPNRSANFIYYKVRVLEGVDLGVLLWCYWYFYWWLGEQYPVKRMQVRAPRCHQTHAKHEA